MRSTCVKVRKSSHIAIQLTCCYERFFSGSSVCYSQYKELDRRKKPKLYLTSKEIRKTFIDYFVYEKNHTYVPSSPVFLNNDASLLFVNAGMNQFKSKLLNKVLPSHEFYDLKRAANSQKCIRISGKHNDLDDVGRDFHHHTFFEMLGNWSFGDYFKEDACRLSWELLTKVYCLPVDQLYVTYFCGDSSLSLPPDEETKRIWLDIGVPASHVLPFGVKENFWDMGTVGPCGPCTEIHYDYRRNHLGASPLQRVNAGLSEVIEIWNLVFIQYKRNEGGELQTLPVHSVDTGMGLERLTSVIQDTASNYDTDIFKPLFQAMEKNFNIRPYGGCIGDSDVSGVDMAYRLIADHSRMFTVAISDGIFPDSYDAGHVLRKIIRRAAYVANRVLKTHPGRLSSLVPYVVETLDFYPEVVEHASEVIKIVDEEEKMLHKIINKGRKARNKMAAVAEKGILNGMKIWELHEVYGLDDNIIQDLCSEINLSVDWDDYKKVITKQEEAKVLSSHASGENAENAALAAAVKILQDANVSCTDDSCKWSHKCRTPKDLGPAALSATVSAIVKDGLMVDTVGCGQSCCIVTDRTNFYSNAGGQVADIGTICSEGFQFCVSDVHSKDGYVFHEGKVQHGILTSGSEVQMTVEKNHRSGCTCNHTATHLLGAALRKIIVSPLQRSSYVGPDNLRFGFSSRTPLTPEQIVEVENMVNETIGRSLPVTRVQMSLDELQGIPHSVLLRGELYPEVVWAIMIGNADSGHVSVEPCCGTHVTNTSDIKRFVIVNSKSHGGTVRTLHAVTGPVAEEALLRGNEMTQCLNDFHSRLSQLEAQKSDAPTYILLLKDVKKMLHDCSSDTGVPLKILKQCEKELKDLKFRLGDRISVLQPTEQESSDLSASSSAPSKTETFSSMNKVLCESGIPSTSDLYKYDCYFKDGKQIVDTISATVTAIFQNGSAVQQIEHGQHGILVTNKTNFYAEYDGQAGDTGSITAEDFQFDVTDVYKVGDYVFHEGWLKVGCLKTGKEIVMAVNQEHRQSCSLNHTAAHLLHSAMRKSVPYVFFQSTFCGPTNLRLQFKAQVTMSLELLSKLEELINQAIKEKLSVSRTKVPYEDLKNFPNIVVSPKEVFSDLVPIVSIGIDEENPSLTSVEHCCGTHADVTSDIKRFVIITSKNIRISEKVMQAVTGEQAELVLKDGQSYDEEMSALEARITEFLNSEEENFMGMWDLIKEIKIAKNRRETDLPLLLFRSHQDKLSELFSMLNKKTKAFVEQGFVKVRQEMDVLLKNSVDAKFIVHKIKAVGDGKKIANTALSSVQDKPALFFVADGHKTVICSCSVPKNSVTPSFSALLWVQPVATFLRGRSRAYSKDPECFFTIETNDVHNVDEAVDIAKGFVEANSNTL